MGDHRHRLSVVLGDKVEDLRTKQELMDELQEMEIKLDKAGVVGLHYTKKTNFAWQTI